MVQGFQLEMSVWVGEQFFADVTANSAVAPKADLPRQNLRDTKKWLC